MRSDFDNKTSIHFLQELDPKLNSQFHIYAQTETKIFFTTGNEILHKSKEQLTC
jgi:hypothetical protein